VRILALALVVAQVMSRGKRIFHRNFEHALLSGPCECRRDRNLQPNTLLYRDDAV